MSKYCSLDFRVLFLSLFTWLVCTTCAWATSPVNLTTDVLWTDTGGLFDPGNSVFNASFASLTDVEVAFNNARRQEESQLGLVANSLGNLTLPSGWSSQSDDTKMLYLLNEERRARKALPILGLPFAGVESSIDALAQGHADDLLARNVTGHNSANGDNAFDRIDNDSNIGNGACNGANGHEFLPRSENIAYFWTSATLNPLYIERSIYDWIYNDSGSGWGHREAALLQDTALNGAASFNNNNGVATTEGLIGIGVAESPTYNPSSFTWSNLGTVVVLNIFDPISNTNDVCDYTLTLTDAGAGTLPIPTALGGDVNGDGTVNVIDVIGLINIVFNTNPETPGADANGDGTVNVLDVIAVINIVF